eukprot:CAMPEP_0185274744 /NCGR_PEP_ID=MMETSP1359-20130426/52542_1 /TAXON_ID=552665 /ORGANISM="Bigelowiella longifila, Strain CCMP242" /LENGTH=316 /DNA_ID=CAMNT_0027867837 /DNA_START=1 /DNA_END=951 /DNA_ORIENTATION=+
MGADYGFFIGTVNLDLSSLEEDETKGDIVFIDIKDSYYNLTRKTLASSSWVYRNTNASIMVKIDDDVYPSAAAFAEAAPFLPRKNLYHGRMTIGSRPFRRSCKVDSVMCKWRISKTEFPGRIYPDYAQGPMYMMSRDAVRVLDREYQSVKDNGYAFPFEDVYTGMLLSDTRISPFINSTGYTRYVRESGHATHMTFILMNWGHSFLKFQMSQCKQKGVFGFHPVPSDMLSEVSRREGLRGAAGMREKLCLQNDIYEQLLAVSRETNSIPSQPGVIIINGTKSVMATVRAEPPFSLPQPVHGWNANNGPYDDDEGDD